MRLVTTALAPLYQLAPVPPVTVDQAGITPPQIEEHSQDYIFEADRMSSPNTIFVTKLYDADGRQFVLMGWKCCEVSYISTKA